MKILIDLTSLADNFSGIELYAQSVALQLIKNQNDEFILVFKNFIPKEFCHVNSNVTFIVLKGKNKLFFNQVLLPWRLRRVKADRYLFLAFTEPFFWFNKGTCNAIHDLSCWDCPGSNKWYMILYWKLSFLKVAYRKGIIFTVSKFSKDRIINKLKVDENRVVVTYSAPSLQIQNLLLSNSKEESIRRSYSLPNKYILSLSTIEPRKNLTLLLTAFSQLVINNLSDVHLVIAGRKGWKTSKLLGNLPRDVLSKIHFTGFVKSEDLPYVYNMAELFVFPSLYEGFGVPPLESILCKTMVLSSDANAMKEILGDNAIFFKNNDIKDFISKVQYCLSLPIHKKECFTKSALENIRSYSWSNVSMLIDTCIHKNYR